MITLNRIFGQKLGKKTIMYGVRVQYNTKVSIITLNHIYNIGTDLKADTFLMYIYLYFYFFFIEIIENNTVRYVIKRA